MVRWPLLLKFEVASIEIPAGPVRPIGCADRRLCCAECPPRKPMKISLIGALLCSVATLALSVTPSFAGDPIPGVDVKLGSTTYGGLAKNKDDKNSALGQVSTTRGRKT